MRMETKTLFAVRAGKKLKWLQGRTQTFLQFKKEFAAGVILKVRGKLIKHYFTSALQSNMAKSATGVVGPLI